MALPPPECTVAYLGPAGTHSHLAAIDIFGPADRHCFRYQSAERLHLVLDAVARGQAGWGVVPYFNTTSGPVRSVCPSVIDVKASAFANLEIVASIGKRITHDLLGSGQLQDVRYLYSKKEALDQCAGNLKSILPRARAIEQDSTAVAVHRAEHDGPTAAAIASHDMLVFHPRLQLLQAAVQDEARNLTQFLVIRRRPPQPSPKADPFAKQTWLVFTSAESNRVLGKLLSTADRWGIPASAISGTVVDPYNFEMRFLLELHRPIHSFKVRFFLSDTSHLDRTVIGSPAVFKTEDRTEIDEWLCAQADNIAEAQRLEQEEALAILPPSTRATLSKFADFRLISHNPVSTMESVWQVLGVVPQQMLNTQVAKDVQTGAYAFCCVPGGCRVDLSRVSHALGGSFCRLGKEELESLGQHVGAISPLTAPRDARIVIDHALVRQPVLFMGSGYPGVSVMIRLGGAPWPIPTIDTWLTETSSP